MKYVETVNCWWKKNELLIQQEPNVFLDFFEATKFLEFLLKSGEGTPAYSHGVTYRM